MKTFLMHAALSLFGCCTNMNASEEKKSSHKIEHAYVRIASPNPRHYAEYSEIDYATVQTISYAPTMEQKEAAESDSDIPSHTIEIEVESAESDSDNDSDNDSDIEIEVESNEQTPISKSIIEYLKIFTPKASSAIFDSQKFIVALRMCNRSNERWETLLEQVKELPALLETMQEKDLDNKAKNFYDYNICHTLESLASHTKRGTITLQATVNAIKKPTPSAKAMAIIPRKI